MCEQLGKLPSRVTRKLEACLTLCVMSWRCSSTSAAMTMSSVMTDMMMGAATPKGWPRIQWTFIVHKETLYLQLTQVPVGSLASEGALGMPASVEPRSTAVSSVEPEGAGNGPLFERLEELELPF